MYLLIHIDWTCRLDTLYVMMLVKLRKIVKRDVSGILRGALSLAINVIFSDKIYSKISCIKMGRYKVKAREIKQTFWTTCNFEDSCY